MIKLVMRAFKSGGRKTIIFFFFSNKNKKNSDAHIGRSPQVPPIIRGPLPTLGHFGGILTKKITPPLTGKYSLLR